jgi:hypothetical protein
VNALKAREDGREKPPRHASPNMLWPLLQNTGQHHRCGKDSTMSLGLILLIILVIFLLGGFSGRFGGYGYGYGHGGVGVIGIILIILVVLLLMGRI